MAIQVTYDAPATNALLGAGEAWTSHIMDLDFGDSFSLSMFSDVPATILLEFSAVGAVFDIAETIEYYPETDPGLYLRIPPMRFCRVTVTNGATPQTAFRFQMISGIKTPNLATSGPTANLPITIGDSAAADPFSRVRISSPQLRLSTLFDSGKRELFWAEALTGTGTSTHLPNERSISLAVSASGDKVVRQTKEYYVYRAGQGQLILVTFKLAAQQVGLRQRVGYFDASDGLFLELNDLDEPAVVLRSFVTGAPVDEAYARSAWSIDKMDGTGPSGKTIDFTKTQILVIDFQWLGVGRVRFGFDVDGVIYYAHEILNANNRETVYMRTPKLPVRYEIEATGAVVGSPAMKQICSAVIREGGSDEPSAEQLARSGASVSVGTAWTTVLGIRLKTSDIRATVRLLSVNVQNLDTDPIEYEVLLNPTYAGTPTWLSAGAESVVEYARFGAAISVNGSGDPVVDHVYPLGGYADGASAGRGATSSRALGETVPVAADIAGNSDEIWIVARVSTGSADVRGILNWAEER